MTRRVHANTVAICTMLKAMHEGATRKEMVDATGLHYNTIHRWVYSLRRAKLVHIEGYEKDNRGCSVVPVYKMGEGKDAKPPAPITNAQKSAKYRKRKRLRDISNALTGAII